MYIRITDWGDLIRRQKAKFTGTYTINMSDFGLEMDNTLVNGLRRTGLVKVVDEEKFFLSVINYGIQYTIVS